MEEIVQLLEKFSNKTATDSELHKLQSLLESNKQEFEKYFASQYHVIDTHIAERITQQRASELLEGIQQKIDYLTEINTQATPKVVSISFWYRMAGAIAACAILLVGVFLVVNQQAQKLPNTAKASQIAPQKVVDKVNNTSIKQEIRLSDGSEVVLYPNGALSYNEPFINNRRDISLVGTAIFKVAKDKTKPFSVYANGIATTALGTTFKVVSKQTSVNVQLFEGKVVVQKIGISGTEKYLLPNQQLVYNLTTDLATITNITATSIPLTNTAIAKMNRKPLAENKTAKTLVFRAQSFTDVITQLERHFKATITIEAATISAINVTAEFKETDSLFEILNTICTINGLSVTQQGNTYIIK